MATLSKELQEYADAREAQRTKPAAVIQTSPKTEPLVKLVPKAEKAEKGKRLSRLTNTSKVKQAALEFAGQHRAKAFTRVSQSFLDAIEAEVRVLILRRVKLQPSVGKTLT